jgi:hypothetical protein
MRGTMRWVATFAGTGLLTCAATLAVFWPTTTQADDPVAQLAQHGSIAAAQTKVDGMLASSKLVADPKRPGRWLVEVEVRNDTDVARSGKIEAVLTEVDYQPMARVMPMPRSVWSQPENITVGSHERIVRRLPLPDGLCKQIAASKVGSDKAMAPRKQFNAAVRAIAG